MSRKKSARREVEIELKKRKQLAEKIFEECGIDLPYLTWANTPSCNLQAYYEENKPEDGKRPDDYVKVFY